MAEDGLQIGPQANLRNVDLSERDLAGADLTGAKLTRADLSRVDLRKAELREADLSGADLSGAKLSEASLSRANLSRANLSAADLSGAKLNGAKLRGADLYEAFLIGAFLTEADLGGAKLGRADLSEAFLVEADLSGAILVETKLVQAKLARADLAIANLSRANLGGANLRGANLSGAELVEADLSGADLVGADLSEAFLVRANLSAADLSEAFLSMTELSGADLSGATCESTVFANLELQDVVGLEQARHSGPSTVGVDTLYISEGRIPDVFLRGCGLPDYFVGMVPGLTVTAPIQHFSAFISYSHADNMLARALYDHLFYLQKVPIWLDEHEIEAGDLIMKSVDRAIRRMDKVVLLCSEASLNSWWVTQEMKRWTEREQELSRTAGEDVSIVVPVDLDGYLWTCDHAYASTIKSTKVLDAQGWEDDAEVQAKIGSQLHRALKLDRRTPLQMMQDQAAGLPDTE